MTTRVHGLTRSRRYFGVARRCGAWLAVLALLIQSWLPLLDASLHAAHDGAADPPAHWGAALDHLTSAGATIERQHPAHPSHQCPLCQFILTLGSFSPPSPAAPVPPTQPAAFVVWPTAPPAVRAAAASSAQARAPPESI